ncbi:MAG: DNA glycosylase AlkZ-like family protein [Fimbriimonadaceae bacterium]
MIRLSKSDARRALVRHHFRQSTLTELFRRLKSVQFDPLSPMGCNHDLVLQSRVPGYRVGDWQSLAYSERRIYDGWDKMACLILTEEYPSRSHFYRWFRPHVEEVLSGFPTEVDLVLSELAERGPLLPSEFAFQQKMPHWKDSWYGPNLTKQILRALWHTGQVMTFDRKGTQHRYALPERVLSRAALTGANVSETEAHRRIVLDRHRAVGLLRPRPGAVVWGLRAIAPECQRLAQEMVTRGELVEVNVDGQMYRASPDFLTVLDESVTLPTAGVLGPLDPLLWDRQMVLDLFEFDYVWEVYKPDHKRRWGYYVLPIRLGDTLVGRFDGRFTKSRLEILRWHWEGAPSLPQKHAAEEALVRFAAYGGVEFDGALPV